ncbi:uncharacterized protein TrAFT101_001388 [Trichoderma asperellum]|uniref:Uncharacterized protein n=1 Tax=Trichoderma asperellum (strain ATCC 204424 / CBS 433.97 / NBRC 101777) TaxID=1042311 RepID=A0A2T3ZDC7_TRIA4|nr:hypothetical protein M441DRAFT_66574 [Trichoderma asperellum CBS 433.97]PTB42805.1 hypothetical protein M441DRAFT_66574 [Trichoderma asperellum CBS 433.97]UKZ85533.1 hypothetical protein TrAFT101_001388 [Trichoderma asperellum]
MPSSKRDYPSSMYPEHGSSYSSSSYSHGSRRGDGDGARRNGDSHRSYNHDYRRGRDYRRGDRSERYIREDSHSARRDSRRDDNRPHDRDSKYNDVERKGRSSSLGILERVLPHDFRPSKADPEARIHRLQKEKECPGFDWTPGLVLGLIGAAALFNHERSLIRRQRKEYYD